MTKEDRQAEIADQRNYLDALYRIITHRLPDDAVVNVLGFSQGTATAARWVAASRCSIDNLILWAGEFPRDLQEHDRFRSLHGHYIYGNQDPFIEDARVAETRSWFDAQGLRFDIRTFEGKHHIHTDTLQELNRSMQKART
jgi:predicted esterase